MVDVGRRPSAQTQVVEQSMEALTLLWQARKAIRLAEIALLAVNGRLEGVTDETPQTLQRTLPKGDRPAL